MRGWPGFGVMQVDGQPPPRGEPAARDSAVRRKTTSAMKTKPMLLITGLAGSLVLTQALVGCGSGGSSASAKPYPLDVCLVSGEKLGGHGAPYVFVHEGQEIKLCCKSCLKDFRAEPAKYLQKLASAAGAGGSTPAQAQ